MKTMTNLKSVLLVLMVIYYNNLFAQDEVNLNETKSRKIFSFSLSTGLSFTNFLGDTKNFADSLNLFTSLNFEEKYRSFIVPAGLSVSLNPTSWFSLKTGVYYSPKGVKYKDMFEIDGYEYGVEIKLCAGYIEIPVMAELSAPVSSNSRIYLNGGIAPSFIVSSKLKTVVWIVDTTPDMSDQEENSEDWKEVNKSDFGYIIGAGFKSKTGYWGIQYVKGTKSVSSAGWDFKNQTLTFILGVNF